MPYSRIRPALAVPCFFAAGCPRRACRDPQAGLPLGRSRTRATGSSGRAIQRGPRGQNRRTGPYGMRRGGQRGHGRQRGASDDRGQDPKTGTAHARRRLSACQRAPGVKSGKATQGDGGRKIIPALSIFSTPSLTGPESWYEALSRTMTNFPQFLRTASRNLRNPSESVLSAGIVRAAPSPGAQNTLADPFEKRVIPCSALRRVTTRSRCPSIAGRTTPRLRRRRICSPAVPQSAPPPRP